MSEEKFKKWDEIFKEQKEESVSVGSKDKDQKSDQKVFNDWDDLIAKSKSSIEVENVSESFQEKEDPSKTDSTIDKKVIEFTKFNGERFDEKKFFKYLGISLVALFMFAGIILLLDPGNPNTDNRGSSLNQGTYSLNGSVRSATLNNGDYAGHQYTGTLSNNLSAPQNFTVDIRIYSTNGNLLASDTNRYRLEPGQSTTVLFFFSGIGNLYGSYDIRVLAYE